MECHLLGFLLNRYSYKPMGRCVIMVSHHYGLPAKRGHLEVARLLIAAGANKAADLMEIKGLRDHGGSYLEDHPRTCKWLGDTPVYKPWSSAIWKGSHNPS